MNDNKLIYNIVMYTALFKQCNRKTSHPLGVDKYWVITKIQTGKQSLFPEQMFLVKQHTDPFHHSLPVVTKRHWTVTSADIVWHRVTCIYIILYSFSILTTNIIGLKFIFVPNLNTMVHYILEPYTIAKSEIKMNLF